MIKIVKNNIILLEKGGVTMNNELIKKLLEDEDVISLELHLAFTEKREHIEKINEKHSVGNIVVVEEPLQKIINLDYVVKIEPLFNN